MKNDIRLGRIAGIPLAANPSVLVIAALLSLSLATGALPAGAPGHTQAPTGRRGRRAPACSSLRCSPMSWPTP